MSVLARSLCIAITVLAAGCASDRGPSAEPATIADPATTQPSYWYDQPASITVISRSLPALWKASENALRQLGFRLDRDDLRSGLITSQPVVSSQFFEVWRSDVSTPDDAARSSLATMRRTVRLEFEQRSDGTIQVVPKVLVEKQSIQERRTTSVTLYRGALSRRESPRERPSGTKESDVGLHYPARFWYPVGRDTALERRLADDIGRRLES
jgi:hypothetical protein